jgi:thermostable 8-oxoguanine DNA glycosylase
VYKLKQEVYEALKEFEKRFKENFPDYSFQLIDLFEGHDVGIQINVPDKNIKREKMRKLSYIAADIEEKYDVYIGLLTRVAA